MQSCSQCDELWVKSGLGQNRGGVFAQMGLTLLLHFFSSCPCLSSSVCLPSTSSSLSLSHPLPVILVSVAKVQESSEQPMCSWLLFRAIMADSVCSWAPFKARMAPPCTVDFFQDAQFRHLSRLRCKAVFSPPSCSPSVCLPSPPLSWQISKVYVSYFRVLWAWCVREFVPLRPFSEK